MRTLLPYELIQTSAGTDCSGQGQSLSCPIPDPQSEFGKMVDDVAGACNDLGSAIGGWIYDETH
jgi:hypothetical protein